MTILETLLLIAPEFILIDPERLESFIELAECQVSETVFGCSYKLAVAYLAAHMLALSERNTNSGTNGQAGNVISKKEGDLALGYSLPSSLSSSEGELETTSYGIEYLRLRNLYVITPNVFYGC